DQLLRERIGDKGLEIFLRLAGGDIVRLLDPFEDRRLIRALDQPFPCLRGRLSERIILAAIELKNDDLVGDAPPSDIGPEAEVALSNRHNIAIFFPLFKKS